MFENGASEKQLQAASHLIVRLERICSSGVLPPAEQMDTREVLCDAYKAFGFPSMGERSRSSNVIPLTSAVESLVRREMEKVL